MWALKQELVRRELDWIFSRPLPRLRILIGRHVPPPLRAFLALFIQVTAAPGPIPICYTLPGGQEERATAGRLRRRRTSRIRGRYAHKPIPSPRHEIMVLVGLDGSLGSLLSYFKVAFAQLASNEAPNLPFMPPNWFFGEVESPSSRGNPT